MNTIEAKRAIHVARFVRLEEAGLTAGDGVAPSNAFVCAARGADSRRENLDFKGRYERLHEIKLTDRADVFAESVGAEEAIDGKGTDEIPNGDPRGPQRTVPKRKTLVGPEKECQEADRQPFAAKPARPRPALTQPPARKSSRQGERASHAEKVSRHEQDQDEDAAPVDPRQNARQIDSGDLRSSQSVHNQGRRNHRQRQLQRKPRVPPLQEAAQ